MKFINALFANMRKTDNTSTDHLERNRLRATLEGLCAEYLDGDEDDILEFEASEKALPYVVSILEEPVFLDKFEFQQVDDSLFQIRQRELSIM